MTKAPSFAIKNTSTTTFVGPHRTVIDPALCPAHDRGFLADGRSSRWALGRTISDHSRIFDVELRLAGGASLVISPALDLQSNVPWENDPLPQNPVEFFGVPTARGVPLTFISLEHDGGHLVVTFRGRFAPMLVGVLVLRYWPGSAFAAGSWSVFCSNPSLPDMTAQLGGELVMGSHTVTLGVSLNGFIGDGQVRRTPVGVMLGPDAADVYGTNPADLQARKMIVGHGLRQVGVCGLYEQARLDPVLWTQAMTNAMWQNLASYDLPPIGPMKNTTATGDEEEQGCEQGKESFYPGGIGAEIPRYLSGLGHGRQPCHYLRQDGSMLLPEDLPNAMLWQGRPLWIQRNSTDPSWLLFGKLRQSDIVSDFQGWFGPDAQHVLIHDIAAGYELTGDEALLDELRHSARNYLWEDTVDPALSTTMPDAARARGWRGMQVAHLAHLLPVDDPLRQRVIDRWKARVEQVYAPSIRAGGPFDGTLFPKNFELQGYDQRAFLYQLAIWGWGGWIAGKVLDHQLSKSLASAAAALVVDLAYQTLQDGFTEWEMIGVNFDGSHANWHQALYQEGQSAHRTGWYRSSWLPLALTVVIESGFGDVSKATALRAALLNNYRALNNTHDPLSNFPADWFPPPQP